MPANDIGIDLGTTNSLVYSTGRGLVLSEPSVVVYDKDTEKIKAIGEEARQMAGHVTSNMEVICPIRQGMIIDFVVMEKMLKYFIAKAMGLAYDLSSFLGEDMSQIRAIASTSRNCRKA